jgi:carboxyl-terminal processing protease
MLRCKVSLVMVSMLCLLLTGMPPACGATGTAGTTSVSEQLYEQLELFTAALAIIESDYVEAPEAQDLIYGALKGMLGALDPYSQFLDPDTYKEIKVETEGQFGGLGIEITIRDDMLTIIAPIDGTPAYRAGIKSGDRIVKINDELTRGITLLEAVKKLRGRPNTSVDITVLRESENRLVDISLTRDIIKIESIRKIEMVDEHVGYIRISEFQEKTPKDLHDALKQLESQGLEGLVLDLRDNPGGLLDVAVEVSETFLPPRAIVVSIAGRITRQNMEFRSRGGKYAEGVSLVILVNEGSASASEIVAGAVQDHKRGIIMGKKSFGKGSVQTVIPLRDGSALRLTTSKYFTPNGRSIHGEGIQPDVEVERMELVKPGSGETKGDKIFEEIEEGKEENIDVQEDADDEGEVKEEAYDNQLSHAVQLLKGLQVFRERME